MIVAMVATGVPALSEVHHNEIFEQELDPTTMVVGDTEIFLLDDWLEDDVFRQIECTVHSANPGVATVSVAGSMVSSSHYHGKMLVKAMSPGQTRLTATTTFEVPILGKDDIRVGTSYVSSLRYINVSVISKFDINNVVKACLLNDPEAVILLGKPRGIRLCY